MNPTVCISNEICIPTLYRVNILKDIALIKTVRCVIKKLKKDIYWQLNYRSVYKSKNLSSVRIPLLLKRGT